MNVYGAQLGGEEKYAKVMNSHADLGTFWKGRILLNLTSYECENPKLESEPIDQKIITQYKNPDVTQWQIFVEAFYGLNFQEEDEKYGLQVRWAELELNFDTTVKSISFFI